MQMDCINYKRKATSFRRWWNFIALGQCLQKICLKQVFKHVNKKLICRSFNAFSDFLLLSDFVDPVICVNASPVRHSLSGSSETNAKYSLVFSFVLFLHYVQLTIICVFSKFFIDTFDENITNNSY